MSESDVSRALHGVWRIALLDGKAEGFFDNTPAGASRSFVMALVVLPLFALQSYLDFGAAPRSGPWEYAVVLAVSYVILWTAWPVVMASLAPVLGCSGRYCLYIAASNWFVLAEFVLLFPLTVLEGLSALSATALLEAQQTIQIVLMLYEWFVAKNTLAVSAATAATLVLIHFLLTVLLAQVVHSMI